MPKKSQKDKEPKVFVKKHPECAADFGRHKGHPFRETFLDYAEEQKLPINALRTWADWDAGRPVPITFAAELSKYLESIGRACPAGLLYVPCPEPTKSEEDEIPDFFGEKQGWGSYVNYLTERFRPTHSIYPREEDLPAVARNMLHCVGKGKRSNARYEEAVALGEKEMHRSPEFLAGQLAMYRRATTRSVMLAVYRRNGRPKVTAACLCVPITPEFFADMKAGRREDLHLTEQDLLPISDHLLMVMVQDLTSNLKHDRRWRSLAMVKTLSYQFAANSVPGKPVRIIMMVGGTPQGEQNAIKYGFLRTNVFTPVTKHHVLIFGVASRVATTKAERAYAQSAYTVFLAARRLLLRNSDASRPPPPPT